MPRGVDRTAYIASIMPGRRRARLAEPGQAVRPRRHHPLGKRPPTARARDAERGCKRLSSYAQVTAGARAVVGGLSEARRRAGRVKRASHDPVRCTDARLHGISGSAAGQLTTRDFRLGSGHEGSEVKRRAAACARVVDWLSHPSG